MNGDPMRITFEGPVGSGKTSAKILTADVLRRVGFNILTNPLDSTDDYIVVSFSGPIMFHDELMRRAGMS